MTDLKDIEDLALMRTRFRAAEEAETVNRAAAEEAISFYFGEQWDDSIERQRTQDGRPCFTLNKLPAITKQVLNEARQNRPAIQVNPVSDGADEDIAETIQGLARHVENNGEGADAAIDTAFEYMVVGGFGSWRILADYLPKSFNQDLFFGRIANPFSVYWDPAATKLDKSDARYCFITSDITKDAFKAEFPHSELAGLSDFEGVGDQAAGWVSDDGCRVVEYFYIEQEEAELVQLTDGRAVWADELPKGARIAKGDDGAPIARKDVRKRAYAAKSNGMEWLEKPKPLPTDDIPVVTIYADQLIIDGETRYKGMIADLAEPQRLFNYNSSAIAETMALGTKSNWIATAEQIEPYQAIWQQANSRNIAVLPYKSVSNAPPPTKIATEAPIQAMSAARMQSADDLRSISGVYDATQAPNGGEESGKAILARRHQTSTGNLNYSANLARGIKRSAQILLKYFPIIYDAPRIMRITGQDMQPKQVMVHAGQPENVPGLLPEGVKGVFDLTVGNYDITVSVTHEETKRQESVDMLLTLAQANPAIVPVIGDLIVNEMDFAGKKAIVERMQRALPPNLQDQQNPLDPAQLAAHNQQMMAQNQQLMQQVQQLTQLMQTKAIEQQGRQQVEQTKLQATEIRAQSSIEAERIKAQAALLTHVGDQHMAHAMALQGQQHEHAVIAHNAANQAAQAQLAASLAPKPEPTPQGA